jgi:hypothetical protein
MPPHFATHFQGLFKIESTSIIIKEESSAIEAAFKAVTDLEAPASLERFALNFEEGHSVSIDLLSPMLTYIHEQDHFKMLTSTPVGLLLWRIEQCLSVDAFYLRRRLPDVKQEAHSTWLDAWQTAVQNSTHSPDTLDTIQVTAWGAIWVRMFLYLLLQRSNATVGQFVEIANSAFAYLALRSGLEPGKHARWDSNLSMDSQLLRPDQPTLMEIVEASARARELTNLENWQLAQHTVDNWRGRAIFGVYAPAFNQLMWQLGSAAWAKTAVDLALGSPMDISAGKQGEVLYVEDILPSHRLERIVRELRRNTWNLNMADASNATGLYTDLPRSVHLPAITETYERLAGASLSFEANWGGRIITQVEGNSESTSDTDTSSDYLGSLLSG